MSKDDQQQEIYHELGYTSQPFPYTTPTYLEAHARLLGLTPPPAKTARVLELGSTFGGNIISQAVYHPEATFTGVELSTSQVEQGQAIIAEMGLNNVQLVQKDILDIDADFGQFDYIIAHGTYSWVNDDVKDAMLRVISENLVDNGIAYVSYNTYPGWHTMEEVRQLMLFANKSRPELSHGDKVKRGKYVASVVGAQILNYDDLQKKNAKFLNALRQTVQKHDYYVGHDHLEPNNDPVYFHQFVDHLAEHGLSYVCDADLTLSMVKRLDSVLAEKLVSLNPVAGELMNGSVCQIGADGVANQVVLEQYVDFVLDTQFRKSIICKNSAVESVNYAISDTFNGISIDDETSSTVTPTDNDLVKAVMDEFYYDILFEEKFLGSFEDQVVKSVFHALMQGHQTFTMAEAMALLKADMKSKSQTVEAMHEENLYQMVLDHMIRGGIRFAFTKVEKPKYVDNKSYVPERFVTFVKSVVNGAAKGFMYPGTPYNEAIGDVTEEDLSFMTLLKESKTKTELKKEIIATAFGDGSGNPKNYEAMAEEYYKALVNRMELFGFLENK